MNIDSVRNALERVSGRAAELLPDALPVVGLLLAGWLLASVLRYVSRRLVLLFLSRVRTRSRLIEGLHASRFREEAPGIIAAFVYWIVLLMFLAAAMERLALPVVTALLARVAYYLPNVLLAVLLAFIGLGAGSLANRWIVSAAEAVGVRYATTLGRSAQAAIVIVALTVGIQQVGIDSSVFIVMIAIVLGTTLGGVALAFGMGSSPVVSNIMSSYYAAKAFRVGDVVRVAGVEGTVREINPTSIVLDCEEGKVHLPARKYCEEVSIILRRDE